MFTRRNVVTLLAGAALSALAALPAAAAERLPVVATFSILGDFVAQVGGDRVDLTTLVGPDGDGHVYSPTPADARRVSQAKVVFTNGLEFEGWIDRLIASSGTAATVVAASNGVALLESEDGDDHGDEHAKADGHSHGHGHGPGHGHSHGHSHGHAHGHSHSHSHSHAHGHAERAAADHAHGEYDPHAWQSVENAKVYVANIRDALIAADPAGEDIYRANAERYLAQLAALDAEIRVAVAGIAPERRKVVTTHDAFRYFAQAYGLTFLAPVGISTEAEASAADIAGLIRQIREEGITAVFVETISDERLMKRISDETGARIGGELYSDALSGPGGPAGTYIDMMRHNISVLADALSS